MFTIIVLLLQWSFIYLMLTDPVQAANYTDRKYFAKIGYVLVGVLALICTLDGFAIFYMETVIKWLLTFCESVYMLLTTSCYVFLYFRFIILLQNDYLRFLAMHVNVFFVFMIVYQALNLSTDIAEYVFYYRNRGLPIPQVSITLEYISMYTDFGLDAFLMYYFISISRNNMQLETQMNLMPDESGKLL